MENMSVKRERDHNHVKEGDRKIQRRGEDVGKLLVEVRPLNERLSRVLELLGEWYEKGKILIFVKSDDQCDALFSDLLRHGYHQCLMLHDHDDESYVESTVSDFKTNAKKILIATSIAARTLDLKELQLVINFDVPIYYEDYVHRIKSKSCCDVTFLSSDDDIYAPHLILALELLNKVVPDDLISLGEVFLAKLDERLSHEEEEEENQVAYNREYQEATIRASASAYRAIIWPYFNSLTTQASTLPA